jgi:hypothetical protein
MRGHKGLSEGADDYPHVVAELEPQVGRRGVVVRRRLIECSTDMQWIVQELHGDQWRNYWHCRTKAGLMVKYRHRAIDALPDRYGKRKNRYDGAIG